MCLFISFWWGRKSVYLVFLLLALCEFIFHPHTTIVSNYFAHHNSEQSKLLTNTVTIITIQTPLPLPTKPSCELPPHYMTTITSPNPQTPTLRHTTATSSPMKSITANTTLRVSTTLPKPVFSDVSHTKLTSSKNL